MDPLKTCNKSDNTLDIYIEINDSAADEISTENEEDKQLEDGKLLM